ncbi:hypothetical protein HDU85_002400 [Gaertneriomyces sp. JEL0708]|nr:hypothetical protein HDU85_002400 [Gaertneriomyces sp. JEL0708]
MSPCGGSHRAADLLEPRDIDPILARFKNIMRQARDKSSQCAVALLDTLQALRRELDPPCKLAKTILELGSKAFILSLKDRIRAKKRDAQEAHSQLSGSSPDADDLQRSQEVEKYLDQLEYHKDPASVWVLEAILSVRRIAQVPKHPTERTNDIYYLADFAISVVEEHEERGEQQ